MICLAAGSPNRLRCSAGAAHLVEHPVPLSVERARRYVGRDAATKRVSGFLSSVRDLRFTPPRLHRLAEEDAVFAEFSGECTVISNGRLYSNDYAFYLRAANGRIALIREYINPLNSMKTFS